MTPMDRGRDGPELDDDDYPAQSPGPQEGAEDDYPGQRAGDDVAEGIDGGDYAGPGELPPEAPDAAARESRTARRIRELNAKAKEETERATTLERELYALRAQQEAYTRQQQQQAQQANEEANLQYLPIEQQVEVKLRRSKEENARQVQMLQWQQWDANDRNAFLSAAAWNPDRRLRAQEVENTFYQAIRAGQMCNREQVYRFLLGQEQEQRLTNKPRPRAPSPRGGGVEPTRSRAGRQETPDQRERRLENIRF